MLDLAERFGDFGADTVARTVLAFQMREGSFDVTVAQSESVVLRITQMRVVFLVIGRICELYLDRKTGQLSLCSGLQLVSANSYIFKEPRCCGPCLLSDLAA